MSDGVHPESTVPPAPVDPGLLAEAAQGLDAAVALRRRIHARPETGLDLPATQEMILDELDGLGLSPSTGTGTTSVVAVLEGEQPGPTTLLRADMDALEMPEDTGLEFASTVAGKMHACGHDAHVAMLVGAGRVLAGRRRDLRGRVVFMFQPGEEGYGGARIMLEEGLLEGHGPIDRAFAIHITPMIPSGAVGCRAGPLLASCDEFRIVVTGRGGHASMPHDACDPVPVACQIVTALQAMVTRVVPAFDPAVVTVTCIQAGTAFNVIPESVACEGTIRSVSDETRELTVHGLRQVAEQRGRRPRLHRHSGGAARPPLPGHRQRPGCRRAHPGRRRGPAWRRAGSAPAHARDGRRGLVLRTPAGTGIHGLPRGVPPGGHASGPQPLQPHGHRRGGHDDRHRPARGAGPDLTADGG